MTFGEAAFKGAGTDLLQRDDRSAAAGVTLRVIKGPGMGAELELPAGKVVVGSRPPADLVVNDPTISGRHCSIEVVPTGVRIIDLASRNGTFYLATQVHDVVVSPGAVIEVGGSQMLIAPRVSASAPAVSDATSYAGLIGASPAMRTLYTRLQRLEQSVAPVLITGETGSGKELVASAIHRHSLRKDGPFEVLDCTAIPRELAESQLFGHVRGAFTGAERDYAGAFERAHGGTLFIDELGELPLDLQPKLLRVLENRQVRRVGGSQPVDVDVRLVCATNRDLQQEVEQGRFRADLYYRVNVATLHVPPLRERREDIPSLVQHFLRDMGPDGVPPSRATLESFVGAHDWPGNVRELRNAVSSALALGDLPKVLGARLQQSAKTPQPSTGAESVDQPFLEARKHFIDSFERDYLENQMARNDNNVSRAARASGMDRAYFRRVLVKHGLVSKE